MNSNGQFSRRMTEPERMNQTGKVWRLLEGSLWMPILSPDYAISSAEFAAGSTLHISIDEVMAQQNALDHPNRLRLLDKFRFVA